METILYRQNFMLAVRQEMGWPAFKPANDCIAWTAGRPMDVEAGLEIARLAQRLGKDLVYTGWVNARASEPSGFCIAYREMFAVDVADQLHPYAANDEAPIVLVNPHAGETFAVDGRGSLLRVPGLPKSLGRGRKLAMKRIKATAASKGDTLLASNRMVPWGSDTIAPDEPGETVVTFR